MGLHIEDQNLIYQWQPPTVFRDAALRLIDINPGDLFGDPSNKFRRESHMAGNFAVAYDWHDPFQVRLTEDGLYDFELETAPGMNGFQAVEADQAGRLRGDEYRNMSETSKALDVDLDAEYEKSRQAIRRMLRQKAA